MIQSYKGARDFYPEQMRLRKWLFDTWSTACESYGYEEYDAPILETTDLFLIKGSQEIIEEETYTFRDRGGRSVTLRTEMTPTVSRMVAARRQELSLPARWYSIPNCWRYERPQRGRGREFYQLNVDIFGVEGIEAELEMLQIVKSIFVKWGAKDKQYKILLNSRKFVNHFLENMLALQPDQIKSVCRIIDKKAKISAEDFSIQLEVLVGPTRTNAIIELTDCTDIDKLPDDLTALSHLDSIRQLLMLTKKAGIKNVVFDPSLMRGFDYYTDIVFEVFDTHPDNNRSMFGGGRYDGLVGQMGAAPIATVGFGMGDYTAYNFLEVNGLLPALTTEVELYITMLGGTTYTDIMPILAELREEEVRVFVDIVGDKKAAKQLKTALDMKVPYMLFVGPDELKSELYTVKTLATHEEQKISIPRLVSVIKKC
jgi:histidyl-tRNA synthetase